MRVWEGEDCSFPKPGELIEIRTTEPDDAGQARPEHAADQRFPRITENVEHSSGSRCCAATNPNDRLGETINRLMKTIVVLKVVRNGRTSEFKVQLLGPTVENRDDSGNLYYRFRPR